MLCKCYTKREFFDRLVAKTTIFTKLLMVTYIMMRHATKKHIKKGLGVIASRFSIKRKYDLIHNRYLTVLLVYSKH